MRLTTDHFLLDLAPRTTMPLDTAGGAVIRVKLGMVWITEEHETGDHVLRIGESYRVRRGGRVVVEALSLARIVVETPAPARIVMARGIGGICNALLRRLKRIGFGPSWST